MASKYGLKMTVFRPLASSVTTPERPTSLPVPAVVEHNAHEASAKARFVDVGHALGAPGDGQRLADWLRNLRHELGLPVGLASEGVKTEQLDKLADKAFEDACHRSNPRPCTRDDLLAMYRESMA